MLILVDTTSASFNFKSWLRMYMNNVMPSLFFTSVLTIRREIERREKYDIRRVMQ